MGRWRAATSFEIASGASKGSYRIYDPSLPDEPDGDFPWGCVGCLGLLALLLVVGLAMKVYDWFQSM